jgi:hypothetical protein
MPVGTTAQRANEQSGDIRFNSTLNLMEYYDGTIWKSIDAPPTISSADVSDFDTAGDTITLTGSNFQSGMTAKLVGNDATEYNASSVTVTSATSASFDITAAMLADNDPFDIIVTNISGLSGTLADALDYAPTPAFTAASGSLSTIYDSIRTSVSITTGATSSDADDTITYAITSGSLPSGLSLNASTGAITGNADAVGSNTTSSFTLQATATSAEDGGTATNTRNYSITVNAPIVSSYTSTGSGTFSVPTGITSIDLLMVAGGGGGSSGNGSNGGAGAGGLIYIPSYPVTPQGSISYTVGGGGLGGHSQGGGSYSYNGQNGIKGQNGQNTTFGSLTATGGGAGGAWDAGGNEGNPGGSGGGGAYNSSGGTALQPSNSGDSGTYGFGYAGGTSGGWGNPYQMTGGGGGGAGAVGNNGSPYGVTPKGWGGNGKTYDISGSSVTYAGGGGGANQHAEDPNNDGGKGGTGGGGSAASTIYNPVSNPSVRVPGQPGTANTGGGGGAGTWLPAGQAPYTTGGGDGGSGVIIVK